MTNVIYDCRIISFSTCFLKGVYDLKMGELKLHEGEMNVMELLWSNKLLAAKDIAKIIKEYVGWEKNTTYTVIKRLIEKGAVERQEPGFMCRALVTKQEIQEAELKALLDKFFSGSFTVMFEQYLKTKALKAAEVLEIERKLKLYRP